MNRMILIVLCLSILAFSCGNSSVTPQAKIGEQVPELVLPDLEGKTVKLSDYSGSVILLKFWATWCPDCREVLPHTQALYEKSHNEGYSVVTVSVDFTLETVQTFMKENGYTFQVLYGGPQIRDQFTVLAIPTLYLIDKKGIIRASFVEYGSKGSDEVDRMIRQLINE